MSASSFRTRWGRRLLRRPHRRAVVAGAVGFVVVVAAVAFVANLALPSWLTGSRADAGPVAGVPSVHRVQTGGASFPVVVFPQRPGWNLIQVGPAERSPSHAHAEGRPAVAVGTSPKASVVAGPLAGASGSWARIRLPAGKSRLWISYEGQPLKSVSVDTGSGPVVSESVAGVDGPECASAAVGGLLAESAALVSVCPADALAPGDASSLRALVRSLAARKLAGITISADSSPRSVAAARVVRAEALVREIPVTVEKKRENALVVVGGWASASAVTSGVLKDAAAGRTHSAGGTYFAPWLLNAPALDSGYGVVVASRFDPRDPQAERYAAQLRARIPTATPTAAGYTAWLAATGVPVDGPTRLFAASRVAFLPAEVSHGHADSGFAWYPGGTIVPVSRPLP